MATLIILALIVVLIVGFLKKPPPLTKNPNRLYDWAEREGYDKEFAHKYIDHLDELMKEQSREKEERKRYAEIRDDIKSNRPLELTIERKTYYCNYFPFRDCYTTLFEDNYPTNYILLSKFRDIPRCIIYNELKNKDIDC